jgi:hypothetical protein
LEAFYNSNPDKKVLNMVKGISELSVSDIVFVLRSYIRDNNLMSTVGDVYRNGKDMMFESNNRTYIYTANDFDGSPVFREMGSMARVELDHSTPAKWFF